MKNRFKLVGFTTIVVIMAMALIGCPDPGSDSANPNGPNGPNGPNVNAPFTISGSFAAQNADSGNATFYAKSTVTPSLSWSRNARAADGLVEVSLEGLLEDGEITFKLKGSYNSETKLYMLSAASSFLRYSISGDISKAEGSKAVVQVKDKTGGWVSIEIDVSASVDGTPPSIDGSGDILDELANGIPEDMWGVWWGLDSLEKSKGDIIQPGNYYYMLDAYTIKQYVNRYSIWNLEAFTCFFEGATVENSVAKGRVEFTYTDQAAIDANTTDAIQNWWINHLIAYAGAKWSSVPHGQSTDGETLAQVKDNANQGWNKWSDPSWTAVLDKYKGPAQADEGNLGTNAVWNSHFGPDTVFSYTAYRNDAYRIQSGKLQFGRYYAANGTDYFDKVPANITGYNNLKWGASHSRERSDAVGAPPSSQIVTGTSGVFTVPDQVTAIRHNNFESKTNVLQVISGAHWSVLDYSLNSFYGKGVKFTGASMDVWVEKDAYVVWQLQLHDGNYPAIIGKWETLEAGKWHTVSLYSSYDGKSFGVASHEAVLYLSTMQILRDGSIEGTNYTENTIYIANASITAQQDNTVVVDVLQPITSNMGNSEYGYINATERDKAQARWLLSGDKLALLKNSSTLEIVLTNTYEGGDIGIFWQDTINYDTHFYWVGASSLQPGTTWNATTKKLSIDLGIAIVDRGLLNDFSEVVFVIQNWEKQINELGIVSANLTGTIASEVVIDTREQYHWLYQDLPVSTDNPSGLEIVYLTTENITALKVVNPSSNNVVGYDLGEYKDQEITITFSARVKRVGSAGTLNWQINNSNYPSVPGAAVNNASVNTWHTMGGTWTGIPTAEYPSLYLSAYENNSASTTYYVTDIDVNVTVESVFDLAALQALDGGITLGVAGDTSPVFDAGNKVVTVTGSSDSLFYFSWIDAGINWSEVNFYDSIKINYAAVIETQEAKAKVVIKKGLNSWEGDLNYSDIQQGNNKSFPLLTKTQLGTASEGVSFQHNSYENPGESLYYIKILSVEHVPGVDPGINWETAGEPFTLPIAVDETALNAGGVGTATKASHAMSGGNLTISYSGTARQTGIIAIPADKKELLFKAASAGGKAIININGATSNGSATYRACLGSISAGSSWDGSTWIGGSGFTAWSANANKETAIALNGAGFASASDRFGWLIIQSEGASTLTITSVTITIVEP